MKILSGGEIFINVRRAIHQPEFYFSNMVIYEDVTREVNRQVTRQVFRPLDNKFR
jgi:hypothetical protein